MTITLLAPDGVPVTAQQERQARAAQHGGGSGRRLGGRSGFRVDTPSNVLTATASAWTLGPCAAMIDPGMTTHQGMYGWSTDANITGALEPADQNNPRKDVLFIQVNDDTAGDGSGLVDAKVVYLAGNPSPTPTAPYADGFLVGTINVPMLGGGNPTVQLNPARYVAAGAILPVSSQEEQDSLQGFKSFTIRRTDLPGQPLLVHDGTAFRAGDESVALPAPGGWAVDGTMSRTPVWGGRYRYEMEYTVSRSVAGFNITGAITNLWGVVLPQGWRPSFPKSALGTVRDGFSNFVANGVLAVQIGSDGNILVSVANGATVNLPQYGSIQFSTTWFDV